MLFSPVNPKPIALGFAGLVRRAVNAGKPGLLKFEQPPENDQAPGLQRRVPLEVSLGSDRAAHSCRRLGSCRAMMKKRNTPDLTDINRLKKPLTVPKPWMKSGHLRSCGRTERTSQHHIVMMSRVTKVAVFGRSGCAIAIHTRVGHVVGFFRVLR